MNKILLLFFVLLSLFSQRSLNTTLIGEYNDGSSIYNDVWGFERDGKQYIMVGKREYYAISIFEINSTNGTAELVGDYKDNTVYHGGHWTEPRYYEKGGKSYIYLPSDRSRNTDGKAPTYILDVTDFSKIQKLGEFGEKSHNIFLYGDKLFTCGSNNSARGGVECWSLENPENPKLEWTYSGHYVHDLWISDNKLYIAEMKFDGGGGSFASYNINSVSGSSLTEENLIFRTLYPGGFTHHLSPTNDHKYLVVVDEHAAPDHIQFWDIRDPNNIKNLWKHAEAPNTIVHNSFIHGDLIYVSYYDRGLVIYDISDKELPIKLAEYDTYPQADETGGYSGAWGVYPFLNGDFVAVSDENKGLVMVEFDRSLRAGKLVLDIKDKDSGANLNASATISINDESNINYKTIDGKTTFKGIPESSITLTISKDGYTTQQYTHSFNLNTAIVKEIKLEKPGNSSLLLNVVDKESKNNISNGLTFQISKNEISYEQVNDQFLFSGISDDSVTIQIQHPDYFNKSFNHLFIKDQKDTLKVELEKIINGELTLHVLDKGSKEIITTELSVQAKNTEIAIINNIITLSAIPETQTMIYVYAEGYLSDSLSFKFKHNTFVTDTLYLNKAPQNSVSITLLTSPEKNIKNPSYLFLDFSVKPTELKITAGNEILSTEVFDETHHLYRVKYNGELGAGTIFTVNYDGKTETVKGE